MGIEVPTGGSGNLEHPPKKISDEADIRVWSTGRMQLIFAEARGVGVRYYELNFKPKDFEELAKAMMYANSEQAMKAFGAALQLGPIARRSIDFQYESDVVVFPSAPNESTAA